MEQLIRKLRRHDIGVDIVNDKLELSIPDEVDAYEIIGEIKQNKEELVSYIKKIRGIGHFKKIEASPVKEYYALSSAQKRFYFLHQFDKTSVAYHMPQIKYLDGNLDKERLKDALNKLIARHESLRTSFLIINDEPVQKIADQITLELECFESTEEEAKNLVQKFIRPFDLSQAPLIRAGLIERAGENQGGSKDYILMVDMHHIIGDGVSLNILLNDFMALYNDVELPELRLQYKDYAEWQQSEEQQKEIEIKKEFWLNEFKEETTTLDLPTDFRRPSTKSYDGGQLIFRLNEEDTKQLKRLAESEGATMFMVILSIYNIFLSKISGREDLVIGTSTVGRQHADLENILGIFINTVSLRNYPKGELGFREFLSKLKYKTLACFDNQSYPYEALIEELRVQRDISRNPLFDVFFSFEHQNTSGNPENNITNVTSQSLGTGSHISKFDIKLLANESSGSISIVLEYATALFKKETVERFVHYFKKVVAAVIADHDVKLSDIEILSEKEKQQLTRDFNNTKTDLPNDKTIIDVFNEQVKRVPSNIAVVCGAEKISYQQLDELSNALATTLKSKVKQSEVVGLYVEPSLEMVIGILGILKSGLGFLPLDPAQHPQRQESILQESAAEVLLSQLNLVDKLSFAGMKVVIDKKNGNAEHKAIVRKKGLAYVIYTSGSTGKPKGVKINDYNVVNYARWFKGVTQLTSADKSVLTSSFAFDLGYSSIFPILLSGGELHLIPTALYQAPDKLLNYISENQITYLKLTPSLFSTLTIEPNFTNATLNSLRYVVLGGEPIQTQDIKKTKSVYNHIQFINHYGPTETTIGAVAEPVENLEEFVKEPTIGKPISNNDVFILDRYGKLLPVGVAGELCIAGAGVGDGYLNAEELTKEKFVTSSLHPGVLYKTGDLVRWKENGKIEFLGRIDDQVKIRGYRIELREIEIQLAAHPDIKESVVIVQEKDGVKYLAAYYVAQSQLKIADVRGYLTTKLPEYMVPSYYVPLEKFPLTPNGKIDRRALRSLEVDEHEDYVAPMGEIEEKLVEIWSEVLRLNKDRISVTRSFFELGGHSLNAVAIVNKMYNVFNIEFSLRELFLKPNIRATAEYVETYQWLDDDTKEKSAETTEVII